MIGRRLTAFALLGALLLVQALGVAHALDHPVLGQADHACAVCLHGQGLDDVSTAGHAATLVLAGALVQCAAALSVFPFSNPALGYHSRAPPILV